ncbi:hypothetical protein [Blautia sp. An81]|uniref:hypothetical protein n=1 Tax=Blautia sp. An81 TaxID=1965659 RepID=UPI000B38C27E|nr:hypothetical protein [Blautia sp. An81]OUN25288.1 hypothetical protein B5G33_18300 [Blautia sp. An81]
MRKLKTVWNSHKKILLAVCLLVVIGAGATIAYYSAYTQALTNTFSGSNIDTEIEEETGINGKKAPSIENTGASECIVRMRVNISPENAGVVLNYDTTNWKAGGDGFYYYQGVLPVDGKTEALFTQVTLNNGVPGTVSTLEEWTAFLKKYPDFSITLYQEASPASVDGESALVNGAYNQDAAMKVWNKFKGTN